MTDRARIKIAAAATAVFLAGISAAGLALHDHPRQAASAPAAATAPPDRTAEGAREQFYGDDHQVEPDEGIEDDD